MFTKFIEVLGTGRVSICARLGWLVCVDGSTASFCSYPGQAGPTMIEDFLFNTMYLLYLIPKNLVSYLTGWLVRLKLPKILQGYLNGAFVRGFSINMSEAEKSLEDYASLEELFTRGLKDRSRFITGGYVSSADGRLVVSRALGLGEDAVQAKGLTYKIQDLTYGKGSSSSAPMNPAWYTTVYLAPHNYHRVHAPFTGTLTVLRHIPGELWPVNNSAVGFIPRLFVRNERLVFDFELADGARAWVVMVGALNVGRMMTRFRADLVTNSLNRQLSWSMASREVPPTHGPIEVKVGDELGVFMLGSTTIVILDQKAVSILNPKEFSSGQLIRMGESLSV
jgi:phosphatidylserine decarboxylase